MTITFTEEELATFSSNLEKWYLGMVKFVFDNFNLNPLYDALSDRARMVPAQVHNLMAAYESKNPKPDWRHIL